MKPMNVSCDFPPARSHTTCGRRVGEWKTTPMQKNLLTAFPTYYLSRPQCTMVGSTTENDVTRCKHRKRNALHSSWSCSVQVLVYCVVNIWEFYCCRKCVGYCRKIQCGEWKMYKFHCFARSFWLYHCARVRNNVISFRPFRIIHKTTKTKLIFHCVAEIFFYSLSSYIYIYIVI